MNPVPNTCSCGRFRDILLRVYVSVCINLRFVAGCVGDVTDVQTQPVKGTWRTWRHRALKATDIITCFMICNCFKLISRCYNSASFRCPLLPADNKYCAIAVCQKISNVESSASPSIDQ